MTRKSEALLRFWRYRAETGKLPGRASRGCAVPSATLKQASCVVGPDARPSTAPADWETAFGGWEILESRLSLELQLIIARYDGSFQSFPMPRSGFSNLAGEAVGLRGLAATSETKFRAGAVRPRQMRVAHPRQFPNSAR